MAMKCIRCGQFGHETPACTTTPQSRIGAYCGGIVTLEHVRELCHIDEDTGCWTWKRSFSRSRTSLPIAWIAANGKTMSVIRWVYEQTRKRPLGRMIVWRTCSNQACVNPDHLMAGSRKQWGKWVAAHGKARRPVSTETRRQIRIDTGHTVIDQAKADYIRRSEATGAQLARELGVSAQVISRVRTGKTWAKRSPTSVFAWAQSQ